MDALDVTVSPKQLLMMRSPPEASCVLTAVSRAKTYNTLLGSYIKLSSAASHAEHVKSTLFTHHPAHERYLAAGNALIDAFIVQQRRAATALLNTLREGAAEINQLRLTLTQFAQVNQNLAAQLQSEGVDALARYEMLLSMITMLKIPPLTPTNRTKLETAQLESRIATQLGALTDESRQSSDVFHDAGYLASIGASSDLIQLLLTEPPTPPAVRADTVFKTPVRLERAHPLVDETPALFRAANDESPDQLSAPTPTALRLAMVRGPLLYTNVSTASDHTITATVRGPVIH